MISFTRLNGIPFAINSDLIERIQETPDTILFMADGTSIIVRERQDDVIRLIAEYRARVLALAYVLGSPAVAESSSAARKDSGDK